MDVISDAEGEPWTCLRGMLGSVFCTRPKFPALGKLEVWCKSRYPPLHMLAPGRRVRDSSAIGSRRPLEVGRLGFVH